MWSHLKCVFIVHDLLLLLHVLQFLLHIHDFCYYLPSGSQIEVFQLIYCVPEITCEVTSSLPNEFVLQHVDVSNTLNKGANLCA